VSVRRQIVQTVVEQTGNLKGIVLVRPGLGPSDGRTKNKTHRARARALRATQAAPRPRGPRRQRVRWRHCCVRSCALAWDSFRQRPDLTFELTAEPGGVDRHSRRALAAGPGRVPADHS